MRILLFLESGNIPNKLDELFVRLESQAVADLEFEVLSIDHKNSTDLSKIRMGTLKWTTLKNPRKLQYGARQKLCFHYAIKNRFDFVIPLQTTEALEIPEILSLINSCTPNVDLVIGKGPRRSFFKNGSVEFAKALCHRALGRIVNFLLRVRFTELPSAYRAYNCTLLAKIPFELNTNDALFDSEVLIQAHAAGAQSKEISVASYCRITYPHVSNLSYSWRLIKLALHYRAYMGAFLYDAKFDIAPLHYPEKHSRYSSHSKIVARVKSSSTVLDIACGRGYISKRLIHEKNCVVDGIDFLSPTDVAKELRQYTQLDLNKDTEKVAEIVRRGHYDFILLPDILEHLNDPEALIQSIREASPISKTCLILASTGNIAFGIVRIMLFLGFFNYGVRGILDRTHRHFYTRKSFARLFQQCGYDIKEQFSAPFPLETVLPAANFLRPLASAIENSLEFLNRIWPSFFAFNIMLEIEAQPTLDQLLSLASKSSVNIPSDEADINDISSNLNSPF